MTIEKSMMGKKSRKQGQDFEKKVRVYYESLGWTVCKWPNNVEFEEYHPQEFRATGSGIIGKMIPAKPKWVFNPAICRRIPMGMSSGFPDFIAFRPMEFSNLLLYDVIGVESKINGKLDKLENEKCQWLIDHKIFSRIVIVSKGEKRGTFKEEKF